MADRSNNIKKFIPQVRQRAYENRNGVYVPRVEGDVKRASWPVCLTCKRDVDSVNVEDIGKNRVTIRATCHGKEAVVVMEFPYQILKRKDKDTWPHVMSAINNAVWFDPSIA
jgi:hypothetical protein